MGCITDDVGEENHAASLKKTIKNEVWMVYFKESPPVFQQRA